MSDSKYSPIVDEEENVAFIEKSLPSDVGSKKRKWSNFSWLQSVVVISLLLNAVAMFNVFVLIKSTRSTSTSGSSKYANLVYDKLVPNTYYSEYWSTNDTQPVEMDDLWDSIDTDATIVSLSREYILEHNLPPSTPFPWDQSRGLYFLQSYHLLHCLKNIRKTLISYERTGRGGPMEHHLHHCLDSIRQYLICHADDTPLAASQIDRSIGQDQLVQCRDLEQLRKWVMDDKDRNACWRSVDDYREIAHELERYAFCPPDSPYKAAMDEYFAANGHKEMFMSD